MRDAIDAFVDRGGNVARLAGNFLWQVRLEDLCSANVIRVPPRLRAADTALE